MNDMNAASAAVALSGLSVSFRQPDGVEHQVLRDLHLDVPRGQFIALVGRSGGGKTTILNVLTGLVKPTSGDVAVLGVRPAEARSRIGFVPARDALLPWRSAVRNVEYSLELRGVPRADRKRIALHYLGLVGLENASDRWPWQLSQGMRQRVALVRAWAVEPELLLMDEPFERGSAPSSRVAHRAPSCSSPMTWTRPSSWPTASLSSMAERSPRTPWSRPVTARMRPRMN
jgi:NitT/TauT family transport system ATP-binding protein